MGHISRIYLPDGKEIAYAYDDLGQLIREDNGQTSQTVVYTYDNAGNILRKETYPYTTGDVQPGSGTVVEYSYQDNVWKDLLTYQSDIGSIEYDSIGNPLRYGQWILTWEAGRQLKSIISKSGLNLSFTYGENGLRTSKTSEGERTTYQVIDGVIRSLTKESWNGEETLTFQYSCGAVLSVIYQGEEYWYIKNAQGDVTGLMDKNGQMVVTYTYDSWGVPVSREGSMKDTLGLLNPFRYREYVYDDESGLYYLQTRYYDPRVGRFLNADIMMASNGDFPSCSVFSYCSNDPVNGSDPSGMSEFQDNYMREQRNKWGSGKQQEYESAKIKAQNEKILHPQKSGSLVGVGGSVVTEYDTPTSSKSWGIFSYKTGTKTTYTHKQYGNPGAPISVFARVVSNNLLASYAGISFNHNGWSLKLTKSLVDIGASISYSTGNTMQSLGISIGQDCTISVTTTTSTDIGNNITESSYQTFSIDLKPLIFFLGAPEAQPSGEGSWQPNLSPAPAYP